MNLKEAPASWRKLGCCNFVTVTWARDTLHPATFPSFCFLFLSPLNPGYKVTRNGNAKDGSGLGCNRRRNRMCPGCGRRASLQSSYLRQPIRRCKQHHTGVVPLQLFELLS